MSFSLRNAAIALALLAAGGARAAGPVLSGVYQVGEVGLVDFSLQDGQVQGRFLGSGVCHLTPGVQVVSGAFEGNVFVGSVLLCQEGPSCAAEKKYPFLGIWRDGALAGSVRLDPGCTSPALEGRSLHIGPASAEDKARVLGGAARSAEDLAQRNTSKKEQAQAAEDDLRQGIARLQAEDYRGAKEALERALAYAPDNWTALYGLGVAQTKLGQATGAVESLERALSVAQRERVGADQLADIHFNVACARVQLAQHGQAIEALRTAARLKADKVLLDHLEHDPDLAPLKNESGFRHLVAEVQVRVAKERGKRPR